MTLHVLVLKQEHILVLLLVPQPTLAHILVQELQQVLTLVHRLELVLRQELILVHVPLLEPILVHLLEQVLGVHHTLVHLLEQVLEM